MVRSRRVRLCVCLSIVCCTCLLGYLGAAVSRGAEEEKPPPGGGDCCLQKDPDGQAALRARNYETAKTAPQPLDLWKVRKYGCGGDWRTANALEKDRKREYPILLTWPVIQGAAKYAVQMKGFRGSHPALTLETTNNSLRLQKEDVPPGRYEWYVSVYDEDETHMGDIETIDPAKLFAVADPDPVPANGKKALIDLYHSANKMKGWGMYGHQQYMSGELLEKAGFGVVVNDSGRLTPQMLEPVDLVICNYYWVGWPSRGGYGFRPFSADEIAAIRDFVQKGGSLLVVGCDRKDVPGKSGKMCEATNPLLAQFGLAFDFDRTPKRVGNAQAVEGQDIITFAKPVYTQLPVAVRGDDAVTVLQVDGIPTVKARQFGQGKLMAAGVGMSFLDGRLADFERQAPLHLVMFYDFVRYLTDVDWRLYCDQLFVESVLAKCDFTT